MTRSSAPRPAPSFHSASAATLPSFSILVGTPNRSSITSASATSLSGMLVEPSTRPAARSITDGIPKPIAPTLSSASGSIAPTMPSSSASCDSVGVGTSCRSCTVPSASIDPVAIFVPPRSTPMTRWAPTGGGYHNAPNGGRREALPALQGRPHEGEGADSAASGARRPGGAEPREAAAASRAGAVGSVSPCCCSASCWSSGSSPATSLSGRASSRRTSGCRRRWRRASRAQDGLLTSKPSLIMLLGTDGDKTAARAGLPPLRLDPARPHRPGAAPDGVPLDPARPPRRHPRPGAEQDQRRLPARRPGADDEDRPRAHRPAAEPRRPRRLRQLQGRDRRARRRRDRRAEADPLQPLRLPLRDRCALPGVAGLALREGRRRRWTASGR